MNQAALFQDLEARGIVKQITDPALEKLMNQESLTLYCGFDPTSDSLHVGSLLPLLTLKRFQNAGHKVIAVVGGATGMIGDPSGKSSERSLLSSADLAKNQVGITQVVSKFLDLKGSNPAKVLNNAGWFNGLSYIDFLRDIGKHFTVNHMLAKESVRARLEDREHGISYTEFSYMLLQAYDFFVLNRDHGCRLQIGGSDQWGNITAGIELTRRMKSAQNIESDGDLYGLTHPLVSKADGTKFGKSEKGTVWLSPLKTSPYQFYQFFINTADADVITFLKYFTFITIDEIRALEESLKSAPEKREAQKVLAREVMTLVHGEAELAKAEAASKALFGGDLKSLPAETLVDVFSEAPAAARPRATLEAGISLVDLLADIGLIASKGAARKEIQAGGVYLNNERESDVARVVTSNDLLASRYLVLRKGKRNYHLVSFS